jgi:lipoprotein signal peptidase
MIWFVFSLTFVLDQLAKFLFLHFSPYYTSINNGALAFNNSQAIVITALFILLVAGLFLRDRKLLGNYLISMIGLGLVFGGSISNLVDRITRGGVIDLGLFSLRTNLADLAVFIGLFLLFYFYFSRKIVERNN